jgi:hypothetical protein
MVVILFFKLIKLFTVFTNPPLHMSHRLKCLAAYPPKFKYTFSLPYFDYHCNYNSAEMAAPNTVYGVTCAVYCNLPATAQISRNCVGRYRSLLSLKVQILIFSTFNQRRNLANNIEGAGGGVCKSEHGFEELSIYERAKINRWGTFV